MTHNEGEIKKHGTPHMGRDIDYCKDGSIKRIQNKKNLDRG